MMELLKTLAKQYSVAALFLGVVLVALPYIAIDKDHYLTTHKPAFLFPALIGVALIVVSVIGFIATQLSKSSADKENVGVGLDLSRVKGINGVLSTTVAGCEIRTVEGCIEDQARTAGAVVVLPCNEYFDDYCVGDTRSALGAFVNSTFPGQVEAFTAHAS